MQSTPSVINVAVPININSLFSYALSPDCPVSDVIGKRVLIDFRGRKIRGYAVSEGIFTRDYEIKKILKVIDKQKVFNEEMVRFAGWIADYYFAGIGEVLSLMVPKGIKPAREQEEIHKELKKNLLSTEQEKIYLEMREDIKKGIDKFYLYGVTGSGKTEIYFKLIEDVLNDGKDVIFLVPEIALSYQTLHRLKERFGSLCAVLHSNLKGSKRFLEYLRLYEGKARIAVGPRSALFAPLRNIGLIIIDEENESSYKSEESPRFHARTASLYRANQHRALLLLGSATPSIESWYYAKKDFFKLYQLDKRFGGASLPDIEIISTEEKSFNKNLSFRMVEEINRRIQNKEQVVLLQNRRGFANIIKCKTCGLVLQCPRCNISFTYHKSKEKLICHHCGYHTQLPEICPECKDKGLIQIGAGTQRIEDEISQVFPFARVQRIDFDSLKSRHELNEIFDKVKKGEIDILVGTQMIAKGLHFPNIKFVGIVNADIMLNIPDFKSSERTFALITQVAGRAGREGAKGFVMIQTINPEHYAIICAKNSDFIRFYEEEIEFRKVLLMPPFSRLIRLIVRGSEENKVSQDVKKVYDLLAAKNQEKIKLYGPSPCMLPRINNNYRYQILMKCREVTLMQQLLREILLKVKISAKNYLEIDVDPVDLF